MRNTSPQLITPRTAPLGGLIVLMVLAMAACKLPSRAKADSGAPVASASARAAHAIPSAPAGYVEATVLDVVPTRSGDAVLLVDDAGTTVLPIFVGGTEAMTIKLRIEGKKYKRPLTHDLLGDVMHDLGGAAYKVQIDALKDDTYIGSAFIEKPDGTIVEIDARPSDCIAMALGEHVPIFVKKRVLESAGMPKSDFDDETKKSSSKRGDPLSL